MELAQGAAWGSGVPHSHLPSRGQAREAGLWAHCGAGTRGTGARVLGGCARGERPIFSAWSPRPTARVLPSPPAQPWTPSAAPGKGQQEGGPQYCLPLLCCPQVARAQPDVEPQEGESWCRDHSPHSCRYRAREAKGSDCSGSSAELEAGVSATRCPPRCPPSQRDLNHLPRLSSAESGNHGWRGVGRAERRVLTPARPGAPRSSP